MDKHKDATSVDASVRSTLVFFSLNFAQAPALLSTTPTALDCQSVPLSLSLSHSFSLPLSLGAGINFGNTKAGAKIILRRRVEDEFS